VVGGKPAITAWGRAMVAAGADGAEIVKVGKLMIDMSEDYAKAQDNAAKSTAFFGKTAVDAFSAANRVLQDFADRTTKGLQGLSAFGDAARSQDWGKASLDAAL